MNFKFPRLPIFLCLLFVPYATYASQESLEQQTQEPTKILDPKTFEEELTRLGNAHAPKSEENKTAYLKTLLTIEESSLLNDLVGINAAALGAWIRFFGILMPIFDTNKDITQNSETKLLLLNALTVGLESTISLFLYNLLVAESGSNNNFKQLIIGIGGTPGTLLYALFGKLLPNKKGGLANVVKAFDARNRDFPAWAQDILSEISDNFAMMSNEEKRGTEQELLAEIQRHQTAGFKEAEHTEHETETHETKIIELEPKINTSFIIGSRVKTF